MSHGRKNINTRVQEVRQKLHFTQEEFGKRLGVTKVAISNIEHEKRNVTDQMRMAICREYNVNEDWLLSGSGEMFLSDEVTAFASFETYIKSIGFSVDHKATKFHYDETEIENGQSVRFPVEDETECILSKDGYSVTLTEDEFSEWRTQTRDIIEGMFYKKVADQQNKK